MAAADVAEIEACVARAAEIPFVAQHLPTVTSNGFLVDGPYWESIDAFDERVSISSIKRVIGTIALFIADWCGLEKI